MTLLWIYRADQSQVRLLAIFPACWESRWLQDLAPHAVCFHCLGNTYKYQAGNRMNALLWYKHLSAACQSNRQQVWRHEYAHTHRHSWGWLTRAFCKIWLFSQVPANLMSFEWLVIRSAAEQRREGWGDRRGRWGRSADSVMGAFTAINPDHRFSDSLPWPHCSLTCHHCLNQSTLCVCLYLTVNANPCGWKWLFWIY